MARNEEKHFCNLNRLILVKEKEEYEKAHPQRPKLNALETPEEIQKWIPSIKKDIDFHLKKTQVTCYSDDHVEESRDKIVKLEKEFKAFIRKIKQLSPSPMDVIPWTSRPYKRKKISNPEENLLEGFKRISTPILDNGTNNSSSPVNDTSFQSIDINWSLMDQPLNFSSTSVNQIEKQSRDTVNMTISDLYRGNSYIENKNQCCSADRRTSHLEKPESVSSVKHKQTIKDSIVNYDSSDSESS